MDKKESIERIVMHAPIKKTEEEYCMIEQHSPESISEQVTKLLNEGWNLYGNPVVYVSGAGIKCYVQALHINRKPYYSNNTGPK